MGNEMAKFAPPGTFETVQQRREREALRFDDGIAEEEEERRRNGLIGTCCLKPPLNASLLREGQDLA